MKNLREVLHLLWCSMPCERQYFEDVLRSCRFTKAETAEIAAAFTYKDTNGRLMVSGASVKELTAVVNNTIETTIRTGRANQ
jgi:hypothetical protein